MMVLLKNNVIPKNVTENPDTSNINPVLRSTFCNIFGRLLNVLPIPSFRVFLRFWGTDDVPP